MTKQLLATSVIGGILGALATLMATRHEFQSVSSAQDARGQQSPARDSPRLDGPRGQQVDSPVDPPVDPRARLDDPDLARFSPQERRNIAVYESVNRGVVNINTLSVSVDAFLGIAQSAKGAGSGAVLDRDGHILTNFHVIEGARQIRVTLHNGDSHDAALVGQDPDNDTAVLKIDAPADVLFPVKLGSSSDLRVGQHVFAIGNPFGLERTLTVGILSSLNRTLAARNGRSMKSIIQIDAALNQGNSGGPLVDSQGTLIGMNTAIASSTGENTGVGFAIPVNTIRRIVPELIRSGRVIRPSVGITRVYETGDGLVIASLSPGGPAEQAGLRGFRMVRRQVRRGPFLYEERSLDRDHADTIVGVDGNRVTTAEQFLEIIEAKKPGDTVTVRVLRDKRPMDVEVTLGVAD